MVRTKRENIQVVVRFRPLNKREKKMKNKHDFKLGIDTEENKVLIQEQQFVFDHVFDENVIQQNVFKQVAKGVVEWVSSGYNSTIFAYGPTGCLDPNTKVRMYDGTLKKAKDVIIGDKLMGDDSTPRTVSKLFYGEDDMYDVIPKKGPSYRVNKGHILTLKHMNRIIDIKITDYLKQSLMIKNLQRGVRTGVEYPEQKLNVNPYVFGLCLDVNSTYIPKQYLVNSRKNRLQLLAGIIDAGGQLEQNIYNLRQTNEKIVDDILTLARSLGFAAYKKKDNSCYITGKELCDIPVRFDSKRVRSRKDQKELFPKIHVEYAGRGPYFGFLLDGNHRFLLEDFTVTHNTGKTHTMFGGNGPQSGIIPRSCNHLFHTINQNNDVIEMFVKCSFLEIYRENVRDLLAKHNNRNGYIPNLRIRQHKSKGIYVQGLIEKFVYTPEEILETIQQGARQRSTASTSLNNVSSRSHAVLTLNVTQRLSDGTEMNSKLHLIDLAGSENVGKSEVKGTSLLEAKQINKSLSALGNVIYALTEKGREHVPYRDSRLTYLLQDSLGGNSKTVLITTATPHSSVYSETINTLKFARRAKKIKNIPKVNRNESKANLIKTVNMLTRQLDMMTTKYEEAKEIVDKVERENLHQNNKASVLLQTKNKRLIAKNEYMKHEQRYQEQRIEQAKKIFKKQRELAQSAAVELYHHKIRICNLVNELEQYKSFYETIKNATNDHVDGEVIKLIVKNYEIYKIPKRKLSVNISRNMPAVEIDSPT